MSLLAESVARDARRAGLLDMLLEAPLVVGVSGGADSLALLSVLRELRGARAAGTLYVAHLDHGFRGEESAADARFVEELAREWGLPSAVAYFDVPAYATLRKLSPEDAARRVRYSFLAGVAEEHGSTVAVAHNADDQAETVLMHLLRGTGISGLAGMRMLSEVPVDAGDPALRPLVLEDAPSKVRVFRPLLGTWRVAIEAHCREAGLTPRLDATNLEPSYRRNLIRHKVLPALETASPQVRRHLVRLADIAAAEDDVLEQITGQAWDKLGITVGTGPRMTVSVEAMASLPLGIARRMVRLILHAVAGHEEGIDFHQVESALQVLSGAPGGPRAIDLPGGLTVRRVGAMGVVEGRDRVLNAEAPASITERPLVLADTFTPLGLNDTLVLANGWLARTEVLASRDALPDPGEYVALFDIDALAEHEHLVLRTWRSGDVMRPLGLRGRKKLQDLLVDAKIPRKMRAYLPVVALPGASGEVLWVPGPGGRRSSLAPISGQTCRFLQIEFQRVSESSQKAEGSA